MNQIPPGIVEWDGDDQDDDAFLLSWASLARDWLRPEEDEAWAHLQSELKNPEDLPKDP